MYRKRPLEIHTRACLLINSAKKTAKPSACSCIHLPVQCVLAGTFETLRLAIFLSSWLTHAFQQKRLAAPGDCPHTRAAGVCPGINFTHKSCASLWLLTCNLLQHTFRQIEVL